MKNKLTKQKTRKEIFKRLDIIWRIVGAFILLLFIYMLFKYKTISGKFSLWVFVLLFLYAIISVTSFLSIKLFKKLKKGINKK